MNFVPRTLLRRARENNVGGNEEIKNMKEKKVKRKGIRFYLYCIGKKSCLFPFCRSTPLSFLFLGFQPTNLALWVCLKY